MATVFLVLLCWNTTWLHSLVCGKRVLFDGLTCESVSCWMILHVESVSRLSVYILVYYEHFIRVIMNGGIEQISGVIFFAVLARSFLLHPACLAGLSLVVATWSCWWGRRLLLELCRLDSPTTGLIFYTGGWVCQMILYAPDHMINSLIWLVEMTKSGWSPSFYDNYIINGSLAMRVYRNTMHLLRKLTMAEIAQVCLYRFIRKSPYCT